MTRHDAEVHRALTDSLNYLDRGRWRACAASVGSTHAGDGACAGFAIRYFAAERAPTSNPVYLGGIIALGTAAGLDLEDPFGAVFDWNDASDWPTVRAALVKAVAATAPPPPDPLNDMDPTSDTRVKELVR